MTTVVVK